MSWLTGLAGRAEDILNKIDQNAATVLHIQQQGTTEEENVSKEIPLLNEIKTEDNLEKPLRTSSPLKLRSIKSENSIKSLNESNRSSRRSSFSSSRHDGTGTGTVIEKELNVSASSEPAQTVTIQQELAALKIVLVEIKSERDELKSELENLMDQLKQATNQTRLTELEDFCIEIEQERNKLLEKTDLLENSNLKYIKSISELETSISKMHQHENELAQKLEWIQQEKEQSFNELQQYRARAQASLQMKEKIIDELKKGLNSDQKIEEFELKNSAFASESLKTENDQLQQQILSLKQQVEQLKFLNSNVEDKNRDRLQQLDEKYEKTLENFKIEQKRNRILEDELKVQNQELVSVRDEIVRLRNTMTQKFYEKETEISKLKTKIAQQAENAIVNGVEDRLQSLTQSLVQKQSALESLTAERNALRLQLEKVENQHRTTMMQLRQQRPQILNMNVTDDAKAQVPNFLQENPFDTTVARRVKRAYSSLDSVSIRLGVFLRRFPLIRIFVIIYMVLLHLWVLVVLLSSTPT